MVRVALCVFGMLFLALVQQSTAAENGTASDTSAWGDLELETARKAQASDSPLDSEPETPKDEDDKEPETPKQKPESEQEPETSEKPKPKAKKARKQSKPRSVTSKPMETVEIERKASVACHGQCIRRHPKAIALSCVTCCQEQGDIHRTNLGATRTTEYRGTDKCVSRSTANRNGRRSALTKAPFRLNNTL